MYIATTQGFFFVLSICNIYTLCMLVYSFSLTLSDFCTHHITIAFSARQNDGIYGFENGISSAPFTFLSALSKFYGDVSTDRSSFGLITSPLSRYETFFRQINIRFYLFCNILSFKHTCIDI